MVSTEQVSKKRAALLNQSFWNGVSFSTFKSNRFCTFDDLYH